MGPRCTLVHRSQIVLGVLEIIFRGDPVAAPDFGLRQRQITVIVSTRILRRLGLGAAESGRFGVLPKSFRHSSRHCIGFHFSVRQRSAAAPYPEMFVIALQGWRPAKAVRRSFEKMAGCSRWGVAARRSNFDGCCGKPNLAPEDRGAGRKSPKSTAPDMGKRTEISTYPPFRELEVNPNRPGRRKACALPPATRSGAAFLAAADRPHSGHAR
jgi:hypothetical protein